MNDEAKTKKAQLESLNQQLDKVRTLQPESRDRTKVPSNAAKAAIDFASATGVGAFLGYLFDQWQHTLPWGLLVGLVIGTIAGIKLMFENQKRDNASSKTDAND